MILVRMLSIAGALSMAVTVAAVAQTKAPTPPLPAAAPAAPVAAAAPAAAAPAKPAVKAAKAERCMRLPLSDVAFGKDGATKAAREKLDEYAAEMAKKRGWPSGPYAKSAETVSCEVYLEVPILGTEYRCLVTTTYCTK